MIPNDRLVALERKFSTFHLIFFYLFCKLNSRIELNFRIESEGTMIKELESGGSN